MSSEKSVSKRESHLIKKEYALVSQDSPRIERFTRHNDIWLFADAKTIDASIELSAIGCILNLADVYRKVSFGDKE